MAVELSGKEKYQNYLTAERIELLYKSAPLHDIGKVGIPDSILLKPGKLTDEEFDIMKGHAKIGPMHCLWQSAIWGKAHFCRWLGRSPTPTTKSGTVLATQEA